MTISIELTREQEAYVVALARERGLPIQTVVTQLLSAQIGASIETKETDGAITSPHMTPQIGDNATPQIGDNRAAAVDEADEAQRVLHARLRDLLARSDALERKPGDRSKDDMAESVAESVREKYRAQGLQV